MRPKISKRSTGPANLSSKLAKIGAGANSLEVPNVAVAKLSMTVNESP
jgi:hypothetical protein